MRPLLKAHRQIFVTPDVRKLDAVFRLLFNLGILRYWTVYHSPTLMTPFYFAFPTIFVSSKVSLLELITKNNFPLDRKKLEKQRYKSKFQTKSIRKRSSAPQFFLDFELMVFDIGFTAFFVFFFFQQADPETIWHLFFAQATKPNNNALFNYHEEQKWIYSHFRQHRARKQLRKTASTIKMKFSVAFIDTTKPLIWLLLFAAEVSILQVRATTDKRSMPTATHFFPRIKKEVDKNPAGLCKRIAITLHGMLGKEGLLLKTHRGNTTRHPTITRRHHKRWHRTTVEVNGNIGEHHHRLCTRRQQAQLKHAANIPSNRKL